MTATPDATTELLIRAHPRFVSALFLFLSACHMVVPVVTAATAVTAAPDWLTTAQTVVTGVKTLTQAAQVACSVEAWANLHGESQLSRDVGKACSW
jgi:hypothetical protein